MREPLARYEAWVGATGSDAPPLSASASMKIRPTVGNGEAERELHPLCQFAERQAFIAFLPDEITGCWPKSRPSNKRSDRDHISTDGVQGLSLLAAVAPKQRQARASCAARLAVPSLGSASLPTRTGTRFAVNMESKQRLICLGATLVGQISQVCAGESAARQALMTESVKSG
jgi:hypothetical protein